MSWSQEIGKTANPPDLIIVGKVYRKDGDDYVEDRERVVWLYASDAEKYRLTFGYVPAERR